MNIPLWLLPPSIAGGIITVLVIGAICDIGWYHTKGMIVYWLHSGFTLRRQKPHLGLTSRRHASLTPGGK